MCEPSLLEVSRCLSRDGSNVSHEIQRAADHDRGFPSPCCDFFFFSFFVVRALAIRGAGCAAAYKLRPGAVQCSAEQQRRGARVGTIGREIVQGRLLECSPCGGQWMRVSKDKPGQLAARCLQEQARRRDARSRRRILREVRSRGN
jgi:hypothetical protein